MNRPKKLDLKNLISWGGSKNPAFFYFTGNFVEFSCKVKSPPGRIALRRSGIISLEQPAAGGESCKTGFFLAENIVLCQKMKSLMRYMKSLVC